MYYLILEKIRAMNFYQMVPTKLSQKSHKNGKNCLYIITTITEKHFNWLEE